MEPWLFKPLHQTREQAIQTHSGRREERCASTSDMARNGRALHIHSAPAGPVAH